MIDLVKRLEYPILHRGSMFDLAFEAAAEIRRLRAIVAERAAQEGEKG